MISFRIFLQILCSNKSERRFWKFRRNFRRTTYRYCRPVAGTEQKVCSLRPTTGALCCCNGHLAFGNARQCTGWVLHAPDMPSTGRSETRQSEVAHSISRRELIGTSLENDWCVPTLSENAPEQNQTHGGTKLSIRKMGLGDQVHTKSEGGSTCEYSSRFQREFPGGCNISFSGQRIIDPSRAYEIWREQKLQS